jgi:EAL domain-containing protein (putative c-di-GMP-specific phosphodiesterase class I)
LTLEVTESVLMRDADATVSHLRRLKEVGVMIAIDDFGSGQSSLTYLRRFPIDELKIDRSFIAAIDDSRESVALLHTLVELGQNLGLTIVAEGIETCAQLDVLRDQHCGYGQGFIFARPQHPNAVEPLLTRGAGPEVALAPPPASAGSRHGVGSGAPSIGERPAPPYEEAYPDAANPLKGVRL